MKPIITVWLLCIWLCGCVNFQKIPVESDYSYLGNFQEYQTYNFFTNLDSNPETLGRTSLIKEAVGNRMRLLGYRYNDINPDISIAISFFEKDTKFLGFSQPEIETWISHRGDNADYQPVNYKLYEGTLLIQLIDNDKTTSIWQGYSSGGFGKLKSDDTRKLNHAVWQIMDKYRVFAKGSLAKAEYISNE